ncbi:MAG: sugar phosphate isomerase/epimerase [Chloroflexi bacterium]|nr:sugar phosphate isomerase/epimerase [Chloroflexota bacterium]
MRYCFANHIFTWHPHRRGGPPPPPEHRRLQIAWIRRAGFEGVEMGDFWMNFYQMSDAELRAIRAEFDAGGLPIVALNCLRKAITPPACADQNRADLRRALEAATALGTGIVNISLASPHTLLGQTTDLNRGQRFSLGGSRQATDAEFEAAASFLRELADQAAVAGLELSIELHHNAITDTGATVARLVRAVNRPNVGGNADLGNLHWTHATPAEPYPAALLAVLDAGMNFWHVKNIQRVYLPELDRAAFLPASLPDGDLDYRWGLLAARQAGYDGWVSIEGAGPGDVLAVAERGLTYLRALERDLADLTPR